MNISVVIPTLNEKDNLPSCLSNLNPQLTQGDEVIVVDGGSSDGTVDIAAEAGCDVYVAEDSSIGEARNIGTDKASNEVIAQTDADALPPSDWLAIIRGHFENDDSLAVLWGTIKDKNGVPIRNLVGRFSTFFRGASGNNTAYTKTAFNSLKSGYPDVSFMEDFAIIEKLSTMGKAVRDNNLVMVMNMDRERYQTIPLTGISIAAAAAGYHMGGKWSEGGMGFALGTLGTEFVYESMTEGYIHHDEFGALVLASSKFVDGKGSGVLTGAGLGIMAHHVLTEGLSALPTQLEKNTDMVIPD